MHELRGLLAHEEAKRDQVRDSAHARAAARRRRRARELAGTACVTLVRQVNAELMQLQQTLQQVLIDEEMLRERRGGVEPPAEPPSLSKGFALVDQSTYDSMCPDEHVEINFFGFKVAVATRRKDP